MKSEITGINTSDIEVTNISTHGFWILVKNKEYFLPFDKFSWFKKAKLEEILDVELLHDFHLYWPKLDIDLEISIIESPEKYPSIYK